MKDVNSVNTTNMKNQSVGNIFLRMFHTTVKKQNKNKIKGV